MHCALPFMGIFNKNYFEHKVNNILKEKNVVQVSHPVFIVFSSFTIECMDYKQIYGN